MGHFERSDMVPTKLPNLETNPRNKILIAIAILLMLSLMLNIGLWQSVKNQSKQIYNSVINLMPVSDELTVKTVKSDNLISSKELTCMATNIYHESASESDLGKIAVAMVVLNRVDSPEFPNTICGVVHQPSRNPENERGCQFSWTCDGKPDNIRSYETYQAILSLSKDILRSRDKFTDIVDGALYYHADYVKPSWAKHFDRVTKIDRHIFYKNKENKDTNIY